MCIFTVSFGSFQLVNSPRDCTKYSFREAKFQNFPGGHTPGAPSVLAPPALDPLLAGSTLNCFHRSCSDAEIGKECHIEMD